MTLMQGAVENILAAIGNTPIVKLQNVTDGVAGNIYANVNI